MNDLVLTDDQTIALLHAGRSGPVPAFADPTALALRNGSRMRRRRQAGQIGAGLIATAAAGAAVFAAMPGLNPDARTDTQIADSPRDSAVSAESARLASFRVLAAALGPDFEVVGEASGTSLYIAPKPGSAGEDALPTGWAAQADVFVAAEAEALGCNPDADRAEGTTTCTTRTLSDGRTVVFESRGGALEPDTRAELRRVHFLQPDGDAIAVTLAVTPESVTAGTVPRDALNAWLSPYDGALIAAATDDAMAPGSVAAREAAGTAGGPDEATAHAQNLQVLTSHLGRGGFERENPDARPPFEDSLMLKLGSAVAKNGLDQSRGAAALPSGYDARASVTVFPKTADNVCDPAAAPELPGDTCERRQLNSGVTGSVTPDADTREVLLASGSTPLDAVPAGLLGTEASIPVEIRHVYYVQPDGDVVDVALGVIPKTLEGEVPREAINAWLKTFEVALITAATDPRMAPGTVAERDASRSPDDDVYASNQALLADHLGPAFRANGRKVLFAADGAGSPSLPGYTTEAVLRSGRSEVELDRMCDESFDQEHTATCERRTTPAGEVIVQTWADSDSALATQGRTAIYFLNPYHEGVVIHFLVRELDPPPAMSAEERTTAILAWLRSYEDELIAAAIDPGVAGDGEAF